MDVFSLRKKIVIPEIEIIYKSDSTQRITTSLWLLRGSIIGALNRKFDKTLFVFSIG
tara:strand:- start:408 stop:578 length:171 start_codon:yes stop_codon:yes gene_type:complete